MRVLLGVHFVFTFQTCCLEANLWMDYSTLSSLLLECKIECGDEMSVRVWRGEIK